MDENQTTSPEPGKRAEAHGREAGVTASGQPSEPDFGGYEVTVETDGSELRDPALPYPLVAIGGSSGGLQAFRDMLEQLSPKTGMTFVYVSHQASHAPHHETQILELLQRHTAMRVLPVEEGQRPLPDHVYMLLPGSYLVLAGGAFHLQSRQESDATPDTINRFFRSVAEDQRNFAVGVVLSGADSDGAEGLKTIKGEGGFALVQSPDSAIHHGMPRRSIAADHVDVVLPPPALAVELERIAQQFTRPELRVLEEGNSPEGEDQAFQRILQLLRNYSGLELR